MVLIEKAKGVAADFGGVSSRTGLADVGVQRHHIRKQVSRGRWVLHGRRTVAVHTRDLSQSELYWRAVWETSPSAAALDGVSALLAAGLNGSDRQAALILAMTVQQRLCSPDQLLEAAGKVQGRRRRRSVRDVVKDVAEGAQSLGELDFARICRRHGVPEPVRQEIVQDARGRSYLDARWACGLVAEIDGAGHRWGLAVTDDNLRQNDLVVSGDNVVRLDTLGLRLHEARFMGQVCAALLVRGEPNLTNPE